MSSVSDIVGLVLLLNTIPKLLANFRRIWHPFGKRDFGNLCEAIHE
jgi:hypothetical protein